MASAKALSVSRWWIPAVLWLGNLHRRLLAVFFVIIGPRLAYRVTGWGALLLYHLLNPLRQRSEAQCKSALRGRVRPEDVPRIAAQSFVNRARNLIDLMLASYLLRPSTYERYGGRIPEPYLGALLDGQSRRQPNHPAHRLLRIIRSSAHLSRLQRDPRYRRVPAGRNKSLAEGLPWDDSAGARGQLKQERSPPPGEGLPDRRCRAGGAARLSVRNGLGSR